MMYGNGTWNEACPFNNASANLDPMTLEDAQAAIEAFIARLDTEENLEIAEIMIFSNHAYAEIIEVDSGIGAMEVIVDPLNGAVSLEHGASIMWNLKYGMHAGSGFSGHGMMGRGMMCGGMMGDYQYFDGELPDVSAEMPVTAEEALEFAQQYLDDYDPGVTVSDEITAFYGYYTIDLEKDGQLVGMLSVNGFNGQVFPHNWHGTFIEMVETDHD